MLIAIFLMSRARIGVIPVILSDAETRDAALEAESRLMEHFAKIMNSNGFLDTKRSGSELLSIASKAATGYGAKLSDFHTPEADVKIIDGRLEWTLLYIRDYGPSVSVAPAEMFSVTIDDETGSATVKDVTAMI